MRRVLIVGLIVGLLGAGIASLQLASSAREHIVTNDEAQLTIELVQMHAEVSEVLLDELNTAVLVNLGEQDQAALAAATRLRRAIVSGVRQDLDAMNSTSAVNRQRISTLRDFLEVDVTTADPEILDLRDFWTMAITALIEMDEIASTDPSLTALATLESLALAPRFVLNAALDVEITARGLPTSNPTAVGYWEDAPGFVTTGAEQLGEDPAAPLPFWSDDAVDHFPDQVQLMAQEVVTSGLYDYDRWIAQWANGTAGPAPVNLDALRIEVISASGTFEDIVTASGTDMLVHLDNDSQADRRWYSWYRFGGAALFGLAAALVMWEIVGVVRRRRALVLAATTDPLTGIGNRRLLAGVVRTDLNNRTYAHHLVGVLDIDRFKMINDGWGHGAGDTALVSTAHRLRAGLERWEAGGGTRRAHLVRLGGDEFLITAHSDTLPASTDLADLLRTAAERPVPVEGQRDIPLEISMGFAVCDGADDLERAMAAADAAAYRSKAERDLARGELVQPIRRAVELTS